MSIQISSGLKLPADTVTSTLIVYGGKGMGKTTLGSVLCEELYANKQRFSVIDPMGVWWGLRHSADGKGPGIEVLILGGKHGDMPIEPTGGAVVADLVADESISVVIDISRKPDGKMWARGERTKFVADYCTRLYERQGERRRPLMQIIDEAGRYVPEVIRKEEADVARCLGAVASLVEEARNVGVGVTLITQRSARMSKAVSELADAMFAFRTVGPRSVDAILDWFGEHVPKDRWKELIGQIRSLPRGTALVVSPGWLQFEGQAAIRMRRTFDSSATPKAGKETHASGQGAKPNLDRYRERMAETIERAKQDDPRELRRQVAELRKHLASPQRTSIQAPDPDAIAKAKREGAEEFRSRIRAAVSQYEKNVDMQIGVVTQRIAELSERIGAFTPGSLIELLDSARASDADPPSMHARPSKPPVPPPPPRPGPNGSAPQGEDNLPAPAQRIRDAAQRILDAIAELIMLRVAQPPRVQVAFLAGYTNLNSKGFTNAIGSLRTAGLIDYPGAGTIALTEAGRRVANESAAPRSSAELLERLVAMLGGANGRIIRQLVDVYPRSLAREDLAARAGYGNTNSKGFTNAIGRLRTLGFIDYPVPGHVQAQPVLFLEGA